MSGSKEIEINTCRECESTYKLVYDNSEASGFPKFCPFCGADIDHEEIEDDNYKEDE